MKNHDEIINELGKVLFVAARNQAAVGAIYDPQEDLQPKDALSVWRGVASSLVNIIEVAIRENKDVQAA